MELTPVLRISGRKNAMVRLLPKAKMTWINGKMRILPWRERERERERERFHSPTFKPFSLQWNSRTNNWEEMSILLRHLAQNKTVLRRKKPIYFAQPRIVHFPNEIPLNESGDQAPACLGSLEGVEHFCRTPSTYDWVPLSMPKLGLFSVGFPFLSDS